MHRKLAFALAVLAIAIGSANEARAAVAPAIPVIAYDVGSGGTVTPIATATNTARTRTDRRGEYSFVLGHVVGHRSGHVGASRDIGRWGPVDDAVRRAMEPNRRAKTKRRTSASPPPSATSTSAPTVPRSHASTSGEIGMSGEVNGASRWHGFGRLPVQVLHHRAGGRHVRARQHGHPAVDRSGEHRRGHLSVARGRDRRPGRAASTSPATMSTPVSSSASTPS